MEDVLDLYTEPYDPQRPMDRVRELGNVSGPFHFDVHTIIYSDDAPKLENALHRMFNDWRINLVNERKEFFRVSIDEIAAAVRQHHGDIEITRVAEAVEHKKTLAMMYGNQTIIETSMTSQQPTVAAAV
jgi:hypothetical protein